jgi:hypothetical protein
MEDLLFFSIPPAYLSLHQENATESHMDFDLEETHHTETLSATYHILVTMCNSLDFCSHGIVQSKALLVLPLSPNTEIDLKNVTSSAMRESDNPIMNQFFAISMTNSSVNQVQAMFISSPMNLMASISRETEHWIVSLVETLKETQTDVEREIEIEWSWVVKHMNQETSLSSSLSVSNTSSSSLSSSLSVSSSFYLSPYSLMPNEIYEVSVYALLIERQGERQKVLMSSKQTQVIQTMRSNLVARITVEIETEKTDRESEIVEEPEEHVFDHLSRTNGSISANASTAVWQEGDKTIYLLPVNSVDGESADGDYRLIFDALSSYDLDQPPAAVSSIGAGLLFSWQCLQISLSNGSADTSLSKNCSENYRLEILSTENDSPSFSLLIHALSETNNTAETEITRESEVDEVRIQVTLTVEEWSSSRRASTSLDVVLLSSSSSSYSFSRRTLASRISPTSSYLSLIFVDNSIEIVCSLIVLIGLILTWFAYQYHSPSPSLSCY